MSVCGQLPVLQVGSVRISSVWYVCLCDLAVGRLEWGHPSTRIDEASLKGRYANLSPDAQRLVDGLNQYAVEGARELYEVVE